MTTRSFMVFYRRSDGAEYEAPNPFIASDPFGAATVALGRLARPGDYTSLAVFDQIAHRIHLYDIVTHKPILVAA